MLNKKNIIFLSDTPPLKYKGSGISVLLYNILIALESPYNLSVITFCRETDATLSEIVNDNLGNKVLVCDQSFLKLYKLVRFSILKKALQFFSFLLCIPHIIKKFNNDQNVFVTMVGASIKPVYKAWLLMKLAPKSKHCLYIVDDLELINKRYNNKFEVFLISVFLKRTIKKSDLLINISEGLKELYLKKYGKDSIVLLPHFKRVSPIKPRITSGSNDFIFLFTGGLNLLYNDSLKLFAVAIEDLNKQNSWNIVFKLIIQTYSSYKDFEALNFNKDYVSFSTNDSRDELLKVYQKCDCFLVPYSFAEMDRGLVITSFPQKIAEVVQYGKKMFIFGPRYSSVNSFFNSLDLAFTCSENKLEIVKTAILSTFKHDFSLSLYEDAYNKYFSSTAVIKTFDSIIKQLN
jgi:glycosyltransferase involved in cell wall biosynthesis